MFSPLQAKQLDSFIEIGQKKFTIPSVTNKSTIIWSGRKIFIGLIGENDCPIFCLGPLLGRACVAGQKIYIGTLEAVWKDRQTEGAVLAGLG